MILSNAEIFKAIQDGLISINPVPSVPSLEKPDSSFNTTSIDLRLSNTISLPIKNLSFSFDLRTGDIINTFKKVYEPRTIDPDGGFILEPNKFVISNTKEIIKLAINKGKACYAARVEGRSSFARCGLLVHFTAPTIHAGYEGTITLELINLGNYSIILRPDMYICQLIFERVEGEIYEAPSQFHGQTTPEGS